MNEMDVMEKTRELGQALLASPEYQAMREAEERMDADESAKALMASFQATRDRVQAIMSGEDVDRDKLMEASKAFREAQEALQANEVVNAYLETRDAFSAVITQVNQVLKFIVTGETEEDACAGDCGSCGGCH